MTDQERNAMQMALEALDSCEFDYDWEERPYKTFDEDLVNGAVDALRKALAQPEQEPVYAFRRKGLDDFCTCDKRRYDELSSKTNLFEVAVLYTAPPSKLWVSLTDEEIWEWFESNTAITRDGALRIARAIEAKLKEKNT